MSQYRIVKVFEGYRIEERVTYGSCTVSFWKTYGGYAQVPYVTLFFAKWKVRRLIARDNYMRAKEEHKDKVVWGPKP